MKSKDQNKNNVLNPSYAIDYYKANQWELKPERKGPVQEGSDYQLPEGSVTSAAEYMSIDGEKYPSQDVKGRVLKEALRIYI